MADPIKLPGLSNIPLPAAPGANPQDVQYATNQINTEFQPQENSLQQALNVLTSNLQSDTQAQQRYGDLADQRLVSIGGQLKQSLQQGADTTGQIYQQGAQQVGAGYDQASQQIQQVGQGLQQSLVSGANKLGLGEALQSHNQYDLNPLARLQAEFGNIQARNIAGKAGAVGNMQALGTAMQGIAQQAVGSSEQNFAQKRADLMTGIQKTIGDLQLQTGAKTQDILNQFMSLAATKGPKFQNILSDLATARSKAEYQHAQDALKNAIAAQKVQLSAASLQEKQRHNTATEAAANFKAGLNPDGTPMSTNTFIGGSGQHGLDQWMKTQGSYFDDSPEGQSTKASLMNFLNAVETRKPSKNETLGLSKTPDKFTIAMTRLAKNKEGDSVNFELPSGQQISVPYEKMEEAIRIYFGKYGTAKTVGGTAGKAY